MDPIILSLGKPSEGYAYIAIYNDKIFISSGNGIGAGSSNAIAVGEFGSIVNGPLSQFTALDNIRYLGMFELNPALTMCVPSTTSTPIPVLKPVPINSMSKSLMEQMAQAIQLMSAGG